MHRRRNPDGGHGRAEAAGTVTGGFRENAHGPPPPKNKPCRKPGDTDRLWHDYVLFLIFVHLTYARWGRVRLLRFCVVESVRHPGNFSGSRVLMDGSFGSSLLKPLFRQSQLFFRRVEVSGGDCAFEILDDRLQMRLDSSVDGCLSRDDIDPFFS